METNELELNQAAKRAVRGEMNLKPKKCGQCFQPVLTIQTDGVDLYYKGEKMPDELMKAFFPCPHCERGTVVWIRDKHVLIKVSSG